MYLGLGQLLICRDLADALMATTLQLKRALT